MSTDSTAASLPGFEHLAAPAEKASRRSGPSREELLEPEWRVEIEAVAARVD